MPKKKITKNKIKSIKSKITKNKKTIIIVTIISVISLVVLLGTSFAVLMNQASSNSQDMYKTGDLSVNFIEDSGSIINLTNQYPMTDEVGIKTTPYTFSVTNTGDYNVSYTIQLNLDGTGELASYIRYQINGSNPSNSSSEAIDVGTLIPGEKRTFELRLWIENDAPATEKNQTVTGNINVSGQATLIPYFIDNSGANQPLLAKGMIPVVYDGVNETWVVADTTKGWYNYSDQVWANAVTVNDESLRTAIVGTPIPMDKINSMWVWIPRYKYEIDSNIGSSSNVTNPPEIDVIFEKETETTGLYKDINIGGYYTHGAFQNGTTNYKTIAYDSGGWDKELTGFWIGKFETGTEGDTCSSSPSESNCQDVTPVIKPDVRSLRYQNVSTQFLTSLKFAGGTMNTSTGEVTFAGNSTYGLTSTTDTHMMKNTEWGAVAYLSQSRYGKMGNANYTGTNKEIYINNSSGYYTGRSGGNIGGSTPINGTYTDQTSTTQYNTYGFYTYNDYLLSYRTNTKSTKVEGKGVGASTTGTIYGIYDMSGGAYEYTMSNWNGYSGYSSTYNSGFNGAYYTPSGSSKTDGISFPSSKYYDKYTTGTSSITITKEKAIKGDATYETMRWYSDSPYFVDATYPWARRGGYYKDTSTAGVFYSLHYYGNAGSYFSVRSVLIP